MLASTQLKPLGGPSENLFILGSHLVLCHVNLAAFSFSNSQSYLVQLRDISGLCLGPLSLRHSLETNCHLFLLFQG